VESFEEMTNILLALGGSPAPTGRAAAIITNSGGFSVIQTDLCLKAGVEVPRFSTETLRKLRQLVPIAGTSIGNPLDAWPIFYNISAEGNLADIIKTVSGDGNIHSLVFQFDQFRYLRRVLGPAAEAHLEKVIQFMIEGFEYTRDKEKKPVVITVSLDPYLEDEEDRNRNLKMKRVLAERGFPVYANLDGAIKAVANLYQLAQFRPGNRGSTETDFLPFSETGVRGAKV
jgi:acyl-CoA synthetase (NDP forming)